MVQLLLPFKWVLQIESRFLLISGSVFSFTHLSYQETYLVSVYTLQPEFPPKPHQTARISLLPLMLPPFMNPVVLVKGLHLLCRLTSPSLPSSLLLPTPPPPPLHHHCRALSRNGVSRMPENRKGSKSRLRVRIRVEFANLARANLNATFATRSDALDLSVSLPVIKVA